MGTTLNRLETVQPSSDDLAYISDKELLSEDLPRFLGETLREAMDRHVVQFLGLQPSMPHYLTTGEIVLAETYKTGPALLKRPKPKPFVLPPIVPSDKYLEIAAAVGLNSGPAMQARIERFFVDRGWLVFDYGKVWDYLQSLCRHTAIFDAHGRDWSWMEQTVPQWVPMRPSDVGRRHDMATRIYNEAVPLHALEKVNDMEAHFGHGVLAFGVSQIVKIPDPFLVVGGLDTPLYPVDVWDEPGFGV